MMRPVFCAIMLTLTLACGGGGSNVGNPYATKLTYTGPADPTLWRLTQDVASTPAHLVLDLMAPASVTSGYGVTLVLTTDPNRTSWHAFSPGVYLQGLIYPSPVVQVASVQGPALRIVAAQAPGTPVNYYAAPILQVELDLAATALPGTVDLTATLGDHLGASGPAAPITIQAGSLQAQ
jgi:hypothetical protein